jgi:putative flippase GtrA
MASLKQISRFGFVGILATATQVSVGLGLNKMLGLAPLVAHPIAFCCALCVSFLGQTRLTFPSATADKSAFVRFTAVALLGLSLNQLIVWIVTSLMARPYEIAMAITIATVPFVTFLLLKFWALRR